MLASKHIALDNCNEPVDILLSSAKTYLEYARFNTVIFPYESQSICPEGAKTTELVHQIYDAAYETASLLVESHRTGRVSTAMYSRCVADITIGLILLFKRAMQLARIEITDRLLSFINWYRPLLEHLSRKRSSLWMCCLRIKSSLRQLEPCGQCV